MPKPCALARRVAAPSQSTRVQSAQRPHPRRLKKGESLDKFNIPAAAQTELRAIVQSTYGDIVVGRGS